MRTSTRVHLEQVGSNDSFSTTNLCKCLLLKVGSMIVYYDAIYDWKIVYSA